MNNVPPNNTTFTRNDEEEDEDDEGEDIMQAASSNSVLNRFASDSLKIDYKPVIENRRKGNSIIDFFAWAELVERLL